MHYANYRKPDGAFADNQPGRLAAYLIEFPDLWVSGWHLAMAIRTTAISTVRAAVVASQRANPDVWVCEHIQGTRVGTTNEIQQPGTNHFYRAYYPKRAERDTRNWALGAMAPDQRKAT